MAVRPFAFGVRLRDGSRTLRVQAQSGKRGFVLEDQPRGARPAKRREHATLATALRDLASTWRGRLN